jgi:hypothetical protein
MVDTHFFTIIPLITAILVFASRRLSFGSVPSLNQVL